MPGWAWALIGCGLVALMALAAILLWQVLTLRPATPIATVPAGQPPVLVTVTAGGSAAASTAFCPQAGGVILFWNSDYNCDNGQGDPGYRERYGAGSQDVNNLRFDDQASAVMIPQGWSVKLYESPGRTGANVCFNTSVTDFTPQGNFPGTSTSINDNVSSMEAFADRQCGAELAAGAPPAPLPPHRKGGDQSACNDVTPCGCLPEELGNMTQPEFKDKYVQDSYIEGDELVVVYNKGFGKIYDTIHNIPNMGVCFDIEPNVPYTDSYWCTYLGPEDSPQSTKNRAKCVKSGLDGTVRCTGHKGDVNWPDGSHPIPGSGQSVIVYWTETVIAYCNEFNNQPGQTTDGLFLLGAIAPPGGLCTVSGYSVVCGTGCCRDNKKCCCFPNVGCQCVRSSCNCNNPKSSACSY
jgi:hypothetical protein